MRFSIRRQVNLAGQDGAPCRVAFTRPWLLGSTVPPPGGATPCGGHGTGTAGPGRLHAAIAFA
jgi:hypothetical protein